MATALTIHQSMIGKKILIAATGLILFGFVIVHLAGNLLVFTGYEAYNAYAAGLKANPALVWAVRVTLLVSLIVHVGLTMQLAAKNARARQTRYQRPREDQVTSYAARTMVITGPLLLAYIVFHIAHFTAPGLDIGAPFNPENVYGNLVRGFREPIVAGVYIFANLMLGLHLFHGGWSALQSLGAAHPRYDKLKTGAAIGLAVVISAGNVLMPIAVLSGLIGTDRELAASDAHPLGEPEAEASGATAED